MIIEEAVFDWSTLDIRGGAFRNEKENTDRLS